MERVLGIGGYFIRAADPVSLGAMEGVGRFGWVTDPEGNRVELWQSA
jgi:predicted enzyme related to lactoylglutathione lyase